MVAWTEVLTIKIEKKMGKCIYKVVSQGGWEPRKHKLILAAQKRASREISVTPTFHLCF